MNYLQYILKYCKIIMLSVIDNLSMNIEEGKLVYIDRR